MTKIFEYKEFLKNGLLEHAQMTYKSELFVQKYGRVYVYGGGLMGNTKEHNPPHFVVELNSGEEFRVKIPTINENDLTEKEIVFLDEHPLSVKDIKSLVSWLKSLSKKAKIIDNVNISNLKYVAKSWNFLNLEDNNVDKIDLKVFE
jgi:hypothetical protein